MADPRKFSGYNNLLVGPPGMEDVIRPLPVHHTGKEAISCWQLTEIEKQAVAETGLIWLAVAGGRQPPVAISGVPMMQQHDDDGVLEKYDVNRGLSPEEIANPFVLSSIQPDDAMQEKLAS